MTTTTPTRRQTLHRLLSVYQDANYRSMAALTTLIEYLDSRVSGVDEVSTALASNFEDDDL